MADRVLFDRFHIRSASDVIRCAGLQQFVQFEGIITGFSQPQKYTQVFYVFVFIVCYCICLSTLVSDYEKYIICSRISILLTCSRLVLWHTQEDMVISCINRDV